MPAVRSVCPFDCPDACGLLVEVDAGRVVKVRGDAEHPYSRGSLCPKMNGYDRTVHSPDRLTRPLIRTGPKGAGEFRPASWDEALALVTARWKEILARDGGEAILPYSYAGSMGLIQRNAGMPFFHRMGATQLARTICTPAQDAGWEAVMGKTPGPNPDVANDSDLVVLWGINAVATNLHFVQRAKQARRGGGRIVLIETYANDSAAIADEVVLVRPSSDGALALAIIHVLARDGLADEAFLAREAVGWPELRARVLADCAPEAVSARVGLAPAAIEALAHTLARARAPFIRIGGGLTRYGNGAMTVRSITALAAVLGAHDRPGGGCLHSTGSAAAFDLAPLLRADLLPRPTRTVNMNQLGRALTELGDPPIRGMYVWCSNPAAVAPDQNTVLRGLARDDLFLVVHERFLTDTARYADVVLPATTSLEHADMYRSYGHYAIQRVRPAIPPLGEARPNWDVFRALAAGMGYDEPLFRMTTDEVIDLLIERIDAAWLADADRARLAAGSAVTLATPAGPRWRTPSGKIELLNPRHPEPLPRDLPSHEDGGALPLRLVTAPALHTLNSTFQERPELRARAGGMVLKLGPSEAATRGLVDGQRVVAANERGEAAFTLRVTDRVPPGVAVAEGVFWLAHVPGKRNVNALTSQRLTDHGAGSTFYDNRIDVRAAD
ncbi:MAG TPA: molybdopterin oxidoreductase family protein [Kofleriaceae bacterium]|jgi:anaerobic selenocysteine-containing dehydrogenase|nr:molybdopterin oxidoreductase family protein [Kofleriaceae bacterium]